MGWGSKITLFSLWIIGYSLSVIVFRVTKAGRLNVPNSCWACSHYTLFAVSYFAAAQIRVVSLGIQIKKSLIFCVEDAKGKGK